MTKVLASYLIALQETEIPDDWWTNWIVGEWVGLDWLLFAGGLLFFGIISYALYSALLYNVVGSNRHPANFRRLLFALFFLLGILWFIYVFANVFGGPVAYTLVGAWLVLLVVLLITRRKIAVQA
jgi:hypothetical protein